MKKTKPASGQSQRQLRAGELVRHALAEIFRDVDIDDAALQGEILTVSEVRMSPDLRHATAFVSTIGKLGNEEAARHLNQHQRFLRGEVAHRVHLKYAPDLVFRADTVGDAAGRIDMLLRSPDVARDLS
jgi:ribosome-binding factor A